MNKKPYQNIYHVYVNVSLMAPNLTQIKSRTMINVTYSY